MFCFLKKKDKKRGERQRKIKKQKLIQSLSLVTNFQLKPLFCFKLSSVYDFVNVLFCKRKKSGKRQLDNEKETKNKKEREREREIFKTRDKQKKKE